MGFECSKMAYLGSHTYFIFFDIFGTSKQPNKYALGVHEPMSCVAKVLQVHAFGLESPRPMLLLSLACHVLNSIILFLISVRVLTTNMSRGRAIGCETEGVAACAAGTCVFAVSPARMECVLWASAQPYLLAALFALLAGN